MKKSATTAATAVLAGAAVGLMLAGGASSAAEHAKAEAAQATSEMKHDMHGTSLEERIASARTPHDHEMLADDFEAAAKDLERQVLKHERMAKAYAAFPGKQPAGSMKIHCDAIAKNFRDAAAKNRELAKFHREEARAAR
jgi:hypothetical protein